MAAAVVQAQDGSTTTIAIVGIVIAGVVGPLLGYLAAWLADTRRFRHERRLKAADDLVARYDDVHVALDRLWEASADMRAHVVTHNGVSEQVAPDLRDAHDAYQAARASIARLMMRPHAGATVLAKAREALDACLRAIAFVDIASTENSLPPGHPRDFSEFGDMPAAVDRGFEATYDYAALARDAVEQLLGRPAEATSHDGPSLVERARRSR